MKTLDDNKLWQQINTPPANRDQVIDVLLGIAARILGFSAILAVFAFVVLGTLGKL